MQLQTVTESRAEQIVRLSQLSLVSEREGDIHTLSLTGEIDLANAAQVDDELRRIEATDAEVILVDLWRRLVPRLDRHEGAHHRGHSLRRDEPPLIQRAAPGRAARTAHRGHRGPAAAGGVGGGGAAIPLPSSAMNDSEHAFISSEVLTNFGKNMGQSQVDLKRLREVLAGTVAEHPARRRWPAARQRRALLRRAERRRRLRAAPRPPRPRDAQRARRRRRRVRLDRHREERRHHSGRARLTTRSVGGGAAGESTTAGCVGILPRLLSAALHAELVRTGQRLHSGARKLCATLTRATTVPLGAPPPGSLGVSCTKSRLKSWSVCDDTAASSRRRRPRARAER